MSPRVSPAAASVLVAGLLDEDTRLVEVARTRLSVHYETGRDDVPVLCLCNPDAVRLPNAVVTPHLPVGPLGARDGHLVAADGIWRVGRWWQPPRPRGLAPPPGTPAVLGVDVPPALEPARLVGAGAGLTPSGDDVLAGALVAAHATAHPRLREWRAATRTALSPRSTTAVSRALLTHALDGWAIPELAEFVVGACSGDAERAATGLLAVGHSSGAALAAGVLYALDGRAVEGAA